MGDAKHDGLVMPGRVVLAHEPEFQLGPMRVCPATRQIKTVGRHEIIEPRVMQVLVALYRAGRIVTRDELFDLCWDGRIVGNDAINRTIGRIRQLATDLGEGAFHVETIPRVGYQLVHGCSPDRSAPGRANRRKFLFAGAAAASVLAGIGAWQAWPSDPGVPAEARQLYDQALAFGSTGLAEDNRKAIAALKQAVRIAPDYADAWAALALAYVAAISNESPDRVEGFEVLRDEAIRRARDLDPGNVDATAAASLSTDYLGRWAEAEESYRRLIAHDARFGNFVLPLGFLYMDVGRWRDAVGALTASKKRGSSPPKAYMLSVALWSSGNIAAAEIELEEALQRWPQHNALWQTKVKLLALTGRPRAAQGLLHDAANRPLEADQAGIALRSLFFEALATRNVFDADRAVDAMVGSIQSVATDGVNTAINCAALGRINIALDLLEGAMLGIGRWAAPGPPDARMATHPLFQPHARSLWTTPRFAALIDRLGLEDYWRRRKVVPDYRRFA
jgi:DNA-binding winged helix-turn-helix (wHTH) protein